MSTTSSSGPPAVVRADHRGALVVLWVAIVVVVVDLAVGGSWDAEWHRTHVFDGFFAPPHIFIYTLVTVALGLVAALNVRPAWRDAFGDRLWLASLQRWHPGALVLLVGGFAGLAAAGPLDATWHSAFGLDETNWSVPHAMLAASLTVIACGFLACRVALAEHLPMRRATVYLFGYLVAFACAPFLGPLQAAPTQSYARAAGSLGQLAADADYQHVVRIVTQAELTHANPAYPLLAALWGGTVLALLRAIDARARYWLVVAVAIGLSLAGGAAREAERLGLAGDPAVTTPLPLLTAVLVFALARPLPETARHALAGLALGVHALLVWGPLAFPTAYLLATVATPVAAVAGAALGRFVHGIIVRPARRATVAFVAVTVLGVPAVTGAVDLALRIAIP